MRTKQFWTTAVWTPSAGSGANDGSARNSLSSPGPRTATQKKNQNAPYNAASRAIRGVVADAQAVVAEFLDRAIADRLQEMQPATA
jgi:hypothetical protein